MSDIKPPHRRLRLMLDLQADSIDDISAALRNLADDIELTGVEERQQTSGGYRSGHHFTLTCDPEQTGDRYREQLEQWRQQRTRADPAS